MALSQYTDRPKIARAEAEKILANVLAWAADTNAVPNARVKVKAIDLFGSLQRGEPFVGDVDIFIEFTTMELGADLEPEDMGREVELLEELSQISDYVSPSSVFDREYMVDVPRHRVFP
jgi:predicted nucleotidyltransferase